MLGRDKWVALTLLLITVLRVIPALAADSRIPHHTPPFVFTGKDLGPVKSTDKMAVRFWLNLRNGPTLDQYLEKVYDPKSPTYRQWLSNEQFNEEFAPRDEDREAVQNYLTEHGLTIEKEPASRLYVTARGTVIDFQNLLRVKLHNFKVGSRIFRANTTDPLIEGKVTDRIKFITGLSTQTFRNHLRRAILPGSGGVYPLKSISEFATGSGFETQCFRSPQTQTFSSKGGTFQAAFSGNRYGSDVTDTVHLPSCGYGPKELRAAYGLNDLFDRKLDGSGQTVVIVDAFGSPTILDDARAFAKTFGIQDPNLAVYQPGGIPVLGPWGTEQQGWAGETTLDVEAVMTMAPGVDIALVEAASDTDGDLAGALAYAIENHLGDVISNSWADNESQVSQAGIAGFGLILKQAAVLGISVNFSSGDSGDLIGTLGYADVSFPTDAPFVTGVGGTSLALNSEGKIDFQTGWGNNATQIAGDAPSAAAAAAAQNTPLSTPSRLGFMFGAGGGASRVYRKPGYQYDLPGTTRMIPDVSFLADPFTGMVTIQSTFDASGNPQSGKKAVGVTGGTSLACPMFSAVWAIANQNTGGSLGVAAPLLYQLPDAAFYDVRPVDSQTNVSGTVTTSEGVALITPLQLAAPQLMTPFYSALFNQPSRPYGWSVITFGTDSTLPTADGWDSVTGLGTPNGEIFIDAIAQLARR